VLLQVAFDQAETIHL